MGMDIHADTFGDEATRDIALGINSRAARRFPQRIWGAARTRITVLISCSDLRDIRLPAWRLEPLNETKRGWFSVRVNDQYRVLFRFHDKRTRYLTLADYHGE
jgi:proteic killer suppression protein